MLNARDPLVQIGITSVVCTVPAIITTVYRLYIRRGRYWFDDAWALLSAMTQMVMFSGAFVHITHSSPKLSMVAAYYMMASAFYSVVWFARLSILFSIIRIHPDERMRKRLHIVGVCFMLTVTFLISQLYWVCEPEPDWKSEESPQCELPKQVVICQLVTDVISDSILVVVPLRLIQTIIDTKLRRRLAVIFSTCLITTAVSMVHAAFIFIHAGPQEVMAAIAEDCVSLIVCNVPIIASTLFTKWQNFTASETKISKTVSIKFASWRTSRHRDSGTYSMGTGTTTQNGLGIGTWLRWDRDLPEDAESDVTTSTNVELDSRTATTSRMEPEPQKRRATTDEEDDHSVMAIPPPPFENKKVYFLEPDP
ncbi:hypothetical protein GYMLUDRAFT_38241 [Collybiopsis luxurians FD-317 M1]|nr:hypothetical protein GYMLUDRAFT_38241 [Collybiopsis luxurians FD-317 M1]